MLPIKYIHFESIDSTNNWAKLNLESCPEDCLTVITADYQTAGRGRYSKQWISQEKQNLLATYVFYLDKSTVDIVPLIQILAKATVAYLKTLNINAQIKWPNDVLVEQKKIAGILCETVQMTNKTAIIEGIGLNVNMPQDILSTIDQPATSLFSETDMTHSIDLVKEKLSKHFQIELNILF
ncbi:MAG: biotin--[acetyl-CoA-carboxylase] ligase [Parachlamydiales bacterium]|nr:biotin--[acetyl-CoA-carboxylase] ligase [Parachlamydiales bacterium]